MGGSNTSYLVLSIVASSGLIVFLIKNGVKIFTTVGDRRKEAILYFVVTLVVLLALVAFIVFSFRGHAIGTPTPAPSSIALAPSENTPSGALETYDPLSPPPETASVGPAPSTDPSASNDSQDYVEDLRYKNAIYSGYVDPETRTPNGTGTMIYFNGDRYTGNWVDGLPDGQGIKEYINGDVYDGWWAGGKRNGHGVYTWSDGRIYDGEYKDDLRNGEGSFLGWTGYQSETGWIGNYYGSNADNEFDGFGEFVFENGDSFKGVFKEGEFWNGTYTTSDKIEHKIVNGRAMG